MVEEHDWERKVVKIGEKREKKADKEGKKIMKGGCFK